MKYGLCIFLFLLTTSAFAQTRVMTYNIRNSHAADGVNKWNKRKQTLANLVLKVNPDVLGTQEVLIDQLMHLKNVLKEYNSFGAGRNNGKHSGEHSAIFYKRDKYELVDGGNFWLSETPGKPGSKSWDAAITRICTWVKLKDKQQGFGFFVFNTHFDHKGKEARLHSVKLLRHFVDSLSTNFPVIVTGDFNFTPEAEPYTIMTDAENYQVALQDARTEANLPHTCCGFDVSNKNCSRIDYVFYNPQFTSLNYTVHADHNGTYYPSDHLAVSADLKIVMLKK